MNKQVCLILMFLLNAFVSGAQYFTTGEDPACLKWRQIVTLDFQLIYPEEFEEKAHVMAAYFEKVYQYGGVTLNHRPAKISIIFHTRTVQSNGLVGWAPRRMELYTPPHQSTYAQDWLEQLALHEFRHVVQVDKIRTRIPLIVRALLGEQSEALITGLYLPFWFMEGDAVVTETALSNSGRGRFPSFLMEHRAQVTEKGIFSFDKALNGSFKDFVPDHYKLGYLLVGETRVKFGSRLWSDVTGKALINRENGKPGFNTVGRILKQETGLNQKHLYESVFDSLRSVWTKEDHAFIPEPFVRLTKPGKTYTEYRYNHFLPTGEIISLKSGYDQIPWFVKIDSLGNEQRVITPGRIFDESVGYRNNLVIWSENIPDTRWQHSGKSYIRIYNIKEDKKTTLIPEFKCFAPSISPDEHNVAVVETDFKNRYYLSVYSAGKHALIARYQTPDNNYLYSPVWKNNEELFVIVLTREGKGLAVIRPFKNEMEILSHPPLGEISHVYAEGDHLFFISGYGGKNELYSMDLSTHRIFREVRARFGIEYPAFSGDSRKLILSNYTSGGFELVTLNKEQIHKIPIEEITNVNYKLADSLSLQEPGCVDFTDVDSVSYLSRPYRKWKNLLNIHSWAPFNLNVDSYEIQPGVSFSSQNKLGTATTTVGYKWYPADRTGENYIHFEYRGWYPVISAQVNSGKRASDYNLVTITRDGSGREIRRDTVSERFTWSQSDIGLDISLPFNLSRGRFSSLLQPEFKYEYTRYGHNQSTPENFVSGNIQSVAWRMYYYLLQRQAYRDLQSRWGFISDVSYRFSPFGDHEVGKMPAIELKSFWPGIMPHHGVSVYLAYQTRGKGKYNFSDVVMIPSGWHSTNSNRLFSSSVRYVLPLFYPEWNFGKLLYLQRINASLFTDYAKMRGDIKKEDAIVGSFQKSMSALGLDLRADCNVMRFYAPVNAGLRVAYLPEQQDFYFQLLFSVDFNSF